MTNSRRDFIKKTLTASAAVSLGGVLPGFTAKSYGQILGANDRVNIGVMGVHARGLALSKNFANQKNCQVITISDVDKNSMSKCIEEVSKIQQTAPTGIGDFRKALENKNLDAMVIATVDHWHAPAAILACKAGKHVYVEKPCSHNPAEGEMMVAAARKYNRKMQMGAQRRSWPNIREGMEALHNGIIGRVYYVRGWYAANRPSIGIGKQVAVPEWLDYELWQGPAPREPYRDNILHYNWHWFWNWGTGEGGNNGTHFLDLMRWGLQVDYPSSVRSVGGRYRYKDDWETPDTQIISFEFPDNMLMEWESRSCNGKFEEDSATGIVFYGENGSLVSSGWNAYKVYDLNNNLLREVRNVAPTAIGSTVDPSKTLDGSHINNFLDSIRSGTRLNLEIEEGFKSTLLAQLGNIAVRAGNISFKTDPQNGHILNNSAAEKYWKREYQPGWEPTI